MNRLKTKTSRRAEASQTKRHNTMKYKSLLALTLATTLLPSALRAEETNKWTFDASLEAGLRLGPHLAGSFWHDRQHRQFPNAHPVGLLNIATCHLPLPTE
jgi:hypothetical protein